MVGANNIELAVSFYQARYTENGKFCKAGAAQLYKKGGIEIYSIPGIENQRYNFVSYRNKEFKDYTPVKKALTDTQSDF